MSETASITSGIAARYAAALFDLAQESNSLDALDADVKALNVALDQSADLRAVIRSPVIPRSEQGATMVALAKKMGLSVHTGHVMELMAARRRLFIIPAFLRDLQARIAQSRGEITADVISAAPLTAEQSKQLSQSLKKQAGKDVKLNAAVDKTLIGGLIVKLGSTMIDTSIRSKLAALQNKMKEVG